MSDRSVAKAFSSEVETGSREENASKQESSSVPILSERDLAELLRRSAGWNGDRQSCQCRFRTVPSAGAKKINQEN
jgi:hypothetical protein